MKTRLPAPPSSPLLSSPLRTFRPNSNSIDMSRALALAVLLLAAAVAAAPLAGAIPIPGEAAGGAGAAMESAAEKAVNPSTFSMPATTEKKD
ncbi:uncharacterized protein LOC123398150 [Hordeum vulgare subsp. vulgare]|uniref:uncharacterized protein LOC123398150 n=1 Tax=Hordeum vulgare subsp. vulgare TaxID=112509 RepID=UPI001D1A429A|nr:uncharacterized protein LOC123398150 [Hordeum vulgare subsp. vulgare]